MLDIKKIQEKKKMLEAQEQQRQGLFYKFRQGDNVFRILPYKDVFYLEVFQHRVGGKLVICPKTFDPVKRCPICEKVEQLREEGLLQEASRLKQIVRYYSVVVYKEDNEEKVGIIGYGNLIWKALANLLLDPEWGDFTDYRNGYAININRAGEGLETEYHVVPRPKKAVSKEKWESWLKKAPKLEEVFKEPSYEELMGALLGEVEIEETEEIE